MGQIRRTSGSEGIGAGQRRALVRCADIATGQSTATADPRNESQAVNASESGVLRASGSCCSASRWLPTCDQVASSSVTSVPSAFDAVYVTPRGPTTTAPTSTRSYEEGYLSPRTARRRPSKPVPATSPRSATDAVHPFRDRQGRPRLRAHRPGRGPPDRGSSGALTPGTPRGTGKVHDIIGGANFSVLLSPGHVADPAYSRAMNAAAFSSSSVRSLRLANLGRRMLHRARSSPLRRRLRRRPPDRTSPARSRAARTPRPDRTAAHG
jgi:hypothetical protein